MTRPNRFMLYIDLGFTTGGSAFQFTPTHFRWLKFLTQKDVSQQFSCGVVTNMIRQGERKSYFRKRVFFENRHDQLGAERHGRRLHHKDYHINQYR